MNVNVELEAPRGISPLDVCRRLPSLASEADRSLIWFLHSLAPNGYERAAREIVEMFPERVKGAHPCEVEFLDLTKDEKRKWAAADASPDSTRARCRDEAWALLPGILMDVCALCDFGALERASYWFQDLRGALAEYQRKIAESIADEFYLTNIGRAVWGALDYCLSVRNGVVIQGDAGRGKSESAKAWCASHRGEVRYVRFRGGSDKQSVYGALAEALGIGARCWRHPQKLKDQAGWVLRRSGLMLVIDEAHYVLPDLKRRGSPDFLDWLDSAIRDDGVPVALVTTNQFAPRLRQFETVHGWNGSQFRRRFAAKWVTLDNSTSEADLARLAARLLPCVGRAGVKLAVGYAMATRDVSGLGDLVDAARLRAKMNGRLEPTFEDLKAAVELDRMPSDKAMGEAFLRPIPAHVRRGKPIRLPAVAETPQQPSATLADASRARGTVPPGFPINRAMTPDLVGTTD